MDEEVTNGGAGWALVAVGGIGAIWAIVYLVLSIGTFAVNGFRAFGELWVAFEYSAGIGFACMSIIGAVLPLIEVIAFVVITIFQPIVIFGGVRFNQFKSFGLVRLAAVLAAVGPILAAILSLLGICKMAGGAICSVFTTCILFNIPTLLLLVGGVGVCVYAFVVMSRPEVAAQFAMNDTAE